MVCWEESRSSWDILKILKLLKKYPKILQNFVSSSSVMNLVPKIISHKLECWLWLIASILKSLSFSHLIIHSIAQSCCFPAMIKMHINGCQSSHDSLSQVKWWLVAETDWQVWPSTLVKNFLTPTTWSTSWDKLHPTLSMISVISGLKKYLCLQLNSHYYQPSLMHHISL